LAFWSAIPAADLPLAAALLAAAVPGDRLSATGIVGAVVLLAAVVRTVLADARPGGG